MNDFEQQYSKSGWDTIVIDTPIVTRDLVEYLLKYVVDEQTISIEFSENVAVLGKNCFKDMRVNAFNFGTAQNLHAIRESAFENATGLWAIDSFPEVKYVGKFAFAGVQCEDSISLPNVRSVAEGCFRYSNINVLNLPNVNSVAFGAFQGAKIAKLELPSRVRATYRIKPTNLNR